MTAQELVSPIPGMALRRTSDGIAVLRLHHYADPDKDDAWRERERKKYTSQAYWDQEIDIKYDALDGQRVYPEFDPTIHVIPDDQVPAKLTRYMSIDPHPRTPHAALWVGIDHFGDWYAYRDLWPSVVYGNPKQLKDIDAERMFTVKEYAETMAVLEGNYIEWKNAETDHEYGIYRRVKVGHRYPWGSVSTRDGENIVYRFMDQAGKAFRASGENQREESYAERYDRFGIQCSDPYKIIEAGEDAVHELLKMRRHDVFGWWPRLHIAASAQELILEFQKHRRKSTKRNNGEAELKQDGVAYRRHVLDNLRYLATAQISYIPTLVS